MSHTNSTANYQLPQFLGTDKPAWLTDVNQAYADIDTAMKANEVLAGQANALATQNASAISTQSGQISTLSTKVTALETAQPTDEAQIETNRQNIATNAQNIVDLDNRMGHTPISGLGDGSATGAIKAVDDKIEAVDGKVGDLADLDTTDKTSIVNAINEVFASGGGDTSTVRYYNGYIQYSTDGGTTWINLINVSTPVQLLPAMTNNTSALGIASVAGVSAGEISAENAYRTIDDSDPSYHGPISTNNGQIIFTFTDPTYVNYMTAKVYKNTASPTFTMDWSADGINWTSGSPIEPSTTAADYTQNVGAVVKAIRVRMASGGGAELQFAQIKAWN